MNLIVCGSGSMKDEQLIRSVLNEVHNDHRVRLVIHGGARGADRIANNWAKDNGIKIRICKAEWKKYDKPAAGIRNQEMIDKGNPGLVVAFWDGKASATKDMLVRARENEVPVQIVIV